MVNPKPSGFSNTKAGKVKILERTKKLVESSEMIITIPIDGVSKELIDFFRKELPKTSTASVVKNKLMGIACEGSNFAPIKEGLRDENMFLFVAEGDAKPVWDAYKKFQKEAKRTEAQFFPKNLLLEGNKYTGEMVTSVVQLPSKKELITKIAQGIKAVPTKVARGVKAVPNKVGRAFGALKDKLEKESANA